MRAVLVLVVGWCYMLFVKQWCMMELGSGRGGGVYVNVVGVVAVV